MLFCMFDVFESFLALSRIKRCKVGMFCMKLGTKHIWYISLCWNFNNRKQLSYAWNCMLSCVLMVFWAFLALSRIKWFKLGLFCMKLGTQNYLVHSIVMKWLELKTIVICFKLRVKSRFCGFLTFFAVSRIKWFKRGLFATKQYLVYITVLICLKLKTIVIC